MTPRNDADSPQGGFGDALFGSRLDEPRHESQSGPTGSDLFIVDNSDDDWKVRSYLAQWADIASKFDIATGYFEIGALLALDGQWQQLDKLRILMGDEVSRRTKRALLEGVETIETALDASIEATKEGNDFLEGVPAIVEALRKRQIECRVYGKGKFHAKAYITHGKHAVIGSTALVGSSNFTLPGLTSNVELNVQLRREVELLQAWYEEHWDKAEDITEEILKVVERHTRDYTPFDVYAKSLQEYFRSYEQTAGEWERAESRMYPHLDEYQKEGYWSLLEIAKSWGGAFLCDGVGLGKTFVGLMLIERLVAHDRKRVALFVPKTGREPVWESTIERFLHGLSGVFSNFRIYNHTDLGRGGDYPSQLEDVKENADVIVIDEAHHFRNPGARGEYGGTGRGIKGVGEAKPSRYRRMFDIAEGKTLYMLTATPVNNRLIDLQHMIELFSRRQVNYFARAPLGIHSLQAHFQAMERRLERVVIGNESEDVIDTNQAEAEQVLTGSDLFQRLVVQRSRAYVKKSQLQHGATEALFPVRESPRVAKFSLKKSYGPLLSQLKTAFKREKPLFSLAIYYPLAYYIGTDESVKDVFIEGRQKQVVTLIRTQFLKRFESSARAFEMSCHALMFKLLAWVTVHSETKPELNRLERWQARHEELLVHLRSRQAEIAGEDDEPDEDVLPPELIDDVDVLPRDDYDIPEILNETFQDLDQIREFLTTLKGLDDSSDDKAESLIQLLKSDPDLKNRKVLIFTEFMATARYLKQRLKDAGIQGVDEIDGSSGRDRGEVIRRFAPYYNGSSSGDLEQAGLTETRVLISTDVLSEGLNLQDATRLINYDLHWNPVRLMQRIGRVDRRLNPEIEENIIGDHPDRADERGSVVYWNFLPPKELDTLLGLYATVARKTLRISKTFGIEGKKLLTADDDYDALRDFTHAYEGTTTPVEEMHLEYQRLLQEYPDLEQHLNNLPGRVFSGKEHPSPDTKAVFFCYALPAPERQDDGTTASEKWTVEAGFTRWYMYDIATEVILENPAEIVNLIRSTQETPRIQNIERDTLSAIRQDIDKHIRNGYLKQVQAPAGVKPVLKAWMELS